VGGARIGRKWHWPERCKSGRITVHRASRPLLTVWMNMVKGWYGRNQQIHHLLYWTSVAHHEGLHDCMKWAFNFLLSPVCSRSVDKLSTVLLHTGDYRKVEGLFYLTVHSMMMGHWGLKYVVDIVKHYCKCDELCAFVGLCCINWIITENVRKMVKGWT